jgi:uncharacterized protein HemY
MPQVIRASAKTKGFVRLPETYVNMGNLWLARQQYGDALTMYEHASKIHNHKSARVRVAHLFCCNVTRCFGCVSPDGVSGTL